MSLPAPPSPPAPPAAAPAAPPAVHLAAEPPPLPGPADWRIAPRPRPRAPTPLLATLALLILAVAAWFGSPWYATWRLVQDARAADVRALSRRMDWPTVRASLEPQLQARADAAWAREKARLARERPNDWWTKLTGLFVTPAVTHAGVGVALTPELVAQTLRTGRAPPVGYPNAPPAARYSPGDTRPTGARYAGGLFDPDLDQFTAVVRSRARPADAVTVRLLRRGVFGWRLAAVDLPPEGR